MTSSFRKINYSLRPGKHAARRMLGEVFARLRPFQPLSEYTYVGFGSVWFEDFILFHRHLGIRDMVSIERDKTAQKRIEVNKPFSSIIVHYKDASVVLPKLHWSGRYCVWLDYEDPLSHGTLLDIRTVVTRIASGSVIAVTVPCKQATEVKAAREDPKGPTAVERFNFEFGTERVAQDVSESKLVGWPFGKLSRRMVKDEIRAALASRNGSSSRPDRYHFKTICEIEYDDGTPMVTVVGIIFRGAEESLQKQCHFETLDFLPKRGKLVRIDVPKLTVREVRYLEQYLPCEPNELTRGEIPASEAKAFAHLYRYLPNFAVLES